MIMSAEEQLEPPVPETPVAYEKLNDPPGAFTQVELKFHRTLELVAGFALGTDFSSRAE
jgi:hypothetical protein